MAKHFHFPLQAYLAGLGTATVLATTSNAAIISLDVSSISGDNGGSTVEQLPVYLSTLTDGALEGRLTLWNLHNSVFDAVGISGVSGAKIAYTGGKTSPKVFHSGDFVDENSLFTDNNSYSTFQFRYDPGSLYQTPDWSPGSYMGFVVEDGEDKHYGWLEVTWDGDAEIFQILSGAYESEANLGIPITPIPEPSSLALLAAGAAGVAALRRRKKAA